MKYYLIDGIKEWGYDELRSQTNPEAFRKLAVEVRQMYAERYVVKLMIQNYPQMGLFRVSNGDIDTRKASLKEILKEIDKENEKDITIHFLGHANMDFYECIYYSELARILNVLTANHNIYINLMSSCLTFPFANYKDSYMEAYTTSFKAENGEINPDFEELDDLIYPETIREYLEEVKQYIPSENEIEVLSAPFHLIEFWNEREHGYDFQKFSELFEPYKQMHQYMMNNGCSLILNSHKGDSDDSIKLQ